MKKLSLILIVLACTTLAACDLPFFKTEAEALSQQTMDRAVAAAGGEEAFDALDDDARRDLIETSFKLVGAEHIAAQHEVEPLEELVGLTFPQLGKAWGLIAALTTLLTGRGRKNLGVIADKEATWPDTWKAALAQLLFTKSPTATPAPTKT